MKPGPDQDSSRLMLGVGVGGLVLATALVQLAWIDAIGAALFPVAIVMLALGSWAACRGTRPHGQRFAGLALVAAALVGLVWAGLAAGDLVFEVVRHDGLANRPAPEPEIWLRVCAGGLLSALVAGLGLRLGAAWSPRECLAWALASLLVPAVALALFFALAYRTGT